MKDCEYPDFKMIVNKKTGFYREIWLSEGSYKNANNFWNRVVTKTKERAKKKNLPHNIDKDYIQTIFPNDSKCPALGIEMEIAESNKSGKDNSPSLDRLIPEKGYVEGKSRLSCQIQLDDSLNNVTVKLLKDELL